MRGRLLSFTAAACIDRYIRVPGLETGRINQPSVVTPQAGGKGINVARVAHALGAPVHLVGHTSKPIQGKVADIGIPATWSDSHQTRECISILDESSGDLTEIYEPLPVEPPEAWPALCAAYRRALVEADTEDVLTISGRLPYQFPDTALSTLVSEARSAGLRVWLDTDDRGLAKCLDIHPELVKINHHEAAAVIGTTITDPHSAASAARILCEQGAESAIITLGDQGSVYLNGSGKVYHQPAPAMDRPLAVGSGDAFFAGLAAATLRGSVVEDALELATATAFVTAQRLVTGNITREDVERAMPELPEVRKLPVSLIACGHDRPGIGADG